MIIQREANVQFKDDLLNRIGGNAIFEFLVLSYCERIQDDPKLKRFYGNGSLEAIFSLQMDTLNAAFYQPENDEHAESLKRKVVLINYRLFEKGLNEKHFDMLAQHFEGALGDCWLTHDVVEQCEKYFKEVRQVFKENGKMIKDEAILQMKQEKRFSDSLRERKALKEVSIEHHLRLVEQRQAIGDILSTSNKTRKRVPFWKRKIVVPFLERN